MNRKILWKYMLEQWLTIATFIGVILGVCVGLIIRSALPTKMTQREIMYLNFIGELFLRMLKSLILPLITSSLVSGIASLNLVISRKLGGRAVAFYLTTTFFAVLLGIFLVMIIQPGVGRENIEETPDGGLKHREMTTADTLLDLVRNMFPPNIIQACLQQYQTELEQPKANFTGDISEWIIKSNYIDNTNVMGIVVISVVVGIAMSALHSTVSSLITFVEEIYRLTMKITSWIISLSPIGIFFLVLGQTVKMDDLGVVVGKLGLYFATVLIGCILQGFVILPIIYYAATRRNPFRFLMGISQALVTAFGTASSSATMPVTLRCIINNNHVDDNVARFMLPIGSAINMDGTALYEAVAAIFIAQLRNIELSWGNIFAISITATAASIGAAGIPSAGLVTMIMVLDTIGLPAEDVSLILAVDWLLDRIRTTINVIGDSFGAGIVYFRSKDELDKYNNETIASETVEEKDSEQEREA